ncbi:MAG: hypothetical protein U0R68_13960 [Candidatus Nanopelagicales bacterium]
MSGIPWVAMAIAGAGPFLGGMIRAHRESRTATPGWRLLHVGPRYDDLEIDGVPLWTTRWRWTLHRLTVPDPQAPGHLMSLTTYRIPTQDGDEIWFACGGLTGCGDWIFYVPE